MKIRNMSLENFRQFKGWQHLDFSTDAQKNVTVIMGENGAGKTKYPVIASRRHAQPLEGGIQQCLSRRIRPAILCQLRRKHVRIAGDTGALIAFQLAFACRNYPFPDGFRAFRRFTLCQIL